MNSIKRRKGSGSEEKKECLTETNFNEIKSLIEYVNKVLMPRIAKLESHVTVLTKAVEINGAPVGAKRTRFNLEIGQDSDSENSEDEQPFY